MIRLSAFVWLVIMGMLGVGLFQVKYAVQAKERELKAVSRQLAANEEAIHVLEAEWSYLNDPLRLADLTRRHTELVPVMADQIATFDRLRPRQPDLPVPELAPGEIPPAPNLVDGSPPAANAQPGLANFAPAAGAGNSDDSTIEAILADMQRAQAVETPAPAPGPTGITPVAATPVAASPTDEAGAQ